jgi:hypothetical protein
MLPMNFLIIASENFTTIEGRTDYKVWYLEMGPKGEVYDLKSKKREELIMSIMENHQRYGRSLWRAFLQNHEESKQIDLYDFISKNTIENTHFGQLPTVHELQETLKHLKVRLEVKSLAS